MSLEGLITIKLERDEGVVREASITSTRRTDLGFKLAGRAVDEALSLVPRLFSICSAAHGVAARRAVAAARGETAVDSHDERRCVLEAIDNHGFQFCVEWPRLSGAPPQVDPLRALRAETARLRQASSLDTGALDDAAAQVLSALRWLDPARGLRLDAWEVRSSPLPVSLEARQLAELPLTAESAARPEWQGVREAGAWSRVGAPGTTVLARLEAQLTHFEQLVRAVKHPAPLAAFRSSDGLGVGLAQTSRGLLVHRARVEGERVSTWHVVAPTEWTFHPLGAVRAALLGAPLDGLEAKLPWLVAAMDPCVPARFE